MPQRPTSSSPTRRRARFAAGILLPYFAVILVNAVKVRGTPDDPNYFVPEPKVAITEAPFGGAVIHHDD